MKKLLHLILMLAFAIMGYISKAQTISVTFSPDTATIGQPVTATVIVQGGQPLTTIDWFDFVGPQSALGDGNDTLEFTFIHVQPLMANRPVTITNGNTVLHDTLYVRPLYCIPCVMSDIPDTVLVGQTFVVRFYASTVIAGVVLNWGDGSPWNSGLDGNGPSGTYTHTYANTGTYNAWWYFGGVDTVYTPIVVVDTTHVPLQIITPMGGEVFNANATDTLVVSTGIFGPLYYYLLRANGDTLDHGQLQAVAAQGNLRKFLITWPDSLEPNARLWVQMTEGVNVGEDTSNPFSIANRVVEGTVYRDANSNNVFDGGEYPYNNSFITANQPNNILWRNGLGNYRLSNLQPGVANVAVINSPMGTSPSPAQHSVDVTNAGVYTGYDFAMQSNISGSNDLSVTTYRNNITAGWNASITIFVYNGGTTTSTPTTVTYNYNPSQIAVISTNPAATQGSGTVTFNVGAIQPLSHRTFSILHTLTVPAGTSITENATINLVDDNAANNSVTNTFTCIGAYDPNAITASPGIIYTPNNINPDYINYYVQFQNTGNAPALNVRVNDTIAANLDMNTFEVLESSHAMNTIIRPDGVVDFMFPNIMLPDSNANEPASHGYIIYRIKPTGTLPLGSSTNAKVDIYFDYNDPITTNTTSTVVMEPVGVKEDAAQLFSIFPNPANGMVYIQPTSAYQNDKLTLRIFAADGRLVREEVLQPKTQHAIDISKLANGIYNLTLTNGKAVAGQKVVKY